jgi:hypothetical protein
VGQDWYVRQRIRPFRPGSRIRLPVKELVHETPGRGLRLPLPDPAAWPILLAESQRKSYTDRLGRLGLGLPPELVGAADTK